MNGEVIPGLYCGGESAGGFSQHGLARAACQGYIAGRAAAAGPLLEQGILNAADISKLSSARANWGRSTAICTRAPETSANASPSAAFPGGTRRPRRPGHRATAVRISGRTVMNRLDGKIALISGAARKRRG